MPIDFSGEFKRIKDAIPKYSKTRSEGMKNLQHVKKVISHEKVAEQFHALDNIITSELLRLRAGLPQKYKDIMMVSPRAVDSDQYQRYTTPYDWALNKDLSEKDFFKYSRHHNRRMRGRTGSTKTRVKGHEGSKVTMQIPIIPVVDYSISQEGQLVVYRIVVMHETEFEDSYDPRTDPLDSDLKKLSDREWELLRRNVNKAIWSVATAGEGVRQSAVNTVMPEMMRIRDENIGIFSKILAPIHDYVKGTEDKPYPNQGIFVGSGEFEE